MMKNVTSLSTTKKVYDNSNDQYPWLLELINETFFQLTESGRMLYKTVTPGLFNIFLENLPEEARQHYTCNTCHRFVSRYGGLVYITDDYMLKSAMWDLDKVPAIFEKSILAMKEAVEQSKIKSIFLTDNDELGEITKGGFTHFYATVSQNYTEKYYGYSYKRRYEQSAMASQDYALLIKAIMNYPDDVITKARLLMQSGKMNRSEVNDRTLEKLSVISKTFHDPANKNRKPNIIWDALGSGRYNAVIHIRGGVLGDLLDGIIEKKSDSTLIHQFNDKVRADRYMRPQSKASNSNIDLADTIFKSLGLDESVLRRRFARFDEVKPFWKPAVQENDETPTGIFGHLKSRDSKDIDIEISAPPKKMTWEKFRNTVLPDAQSIKVSVGRTDMFIAVVTEAIKDSKPILKWDNLDNRNPLSWYTYAQLMTASDWNVTPGFVDVKGIMAYPSELTEGFNSPYHGVIMLIDGCKDNNHKSCGAGLFPEILTHEFYEIRKTIEEYSRTATIEGFDDSSACGITRPSSQEVWNLVLKVKNELGWMLYEIDRYE